MKRTGTRVPALKNDSTLTNRVAPRTPRRQNTSTYLQEREKERERQGNQWRRNQLYHNSMSERFLCFLRRRRRTTSGPLIEMHVANVSGNGNKSQGWISSAPLAARALGKELLEKPIKPRRRGSAPWVRRKTEGLDVGLHLDSALKVNQERTEHDQTILERINITIFVENWDHNSVTILF